MKKILLAAALTTTGLITYAQCEKKVVLTSSKTEHLRADSTIERSEDEHTVIEFDKSTISITPGENHMTGTIKSYTCDWTTPYKVGKTRLKVTLTNNEGESKGATLTIEGKDGRIVLLAELDDMPDRKIRLVADKFEEKQ
jgi:hypothetical protein